MAIPDLATWDGSVAGCGTIAATEGVNVRVEPGGEIVGQLEMGAPVWIFCTTGPWYLVQALGANWQQTAGWAHSDWVRLET